MKSGMQIQVWIPSLTSHPIAAAQRSGRATEGSSQVPPPSIAHGLLCQDSRITPGSVELLLSNGFSHSRTFQQLRVKVQLDLGRDRSADEQ